MAKRFLPCGIPSICKSKFGRIDDEEAQGYMSTKKGHHSIDRLCTEYELIAEVGYRLLLCAILLRPHLLKL